MLNLLGEHKCKVDSKGRMMFPAKLRKALDKVLHHGLIINRDIFEKCLVLYPKPEWDKVNAEMSRLSRYEPEHKLFQRKFLMGASNVELDKTGRLLIPSMLLEFAGIDPKAGNEVIVSGMGETIEIWSSKMHAQRMVGDDVDMSKLAPKVRQDIENPDRVTGSDK